MQLTEIIVCYLHIEFNHTMKVVFTQKQVRDWKRINDNFSIKKRENLWDDLFNTSY